MKEEDFNKVINLLSLGKNLLGIGQKNISDLTLWLEDTKQFLNDFNNYFKLENITIDAMVYIINNHKELILKEIVNKHAT